MHNCVGKPLFGLSEGGLFLLYSSGAGRSDIYKKNILNFHIHLKEKK